MTSELVEKAHGVLREVDRVVLGKQTETAEILTSFLANGHVLLEDIPGVGKTTLATAFSKAMGLECKRVQFTPDVMPSDLTGFSVYRRDQEKFVYQEGSVFCNILLADEINRTSPKTQSALLEVMEERKVSVDGVTRDAPSPFLVIATQNPSGAAGTQLLPEAQIDRFMITLTLGYPDYLSELEIARTAGAGARTDNVTPVITREEFLAMQEQIHDIYIKDVVYDYIIKLVTATRNHSFIERGASPRATIALVKSSKAYAWLQGRDYVIPTDVITQLPYVLMHRISLSMAARMNGSKRTDVINDLLRQTPQPYLGGEK
ncbi:MAG: MoxR family ATPase [Clostridia bacterium]|nr:MoxR family ATPase [Clostridia bacterium]